MLTIKDVKRKGKLMQLIVEDNSIPPQKFSVEIDANVKESELWNHIKTHYQRVMEKEEAAVADAALESLWKNKINSTI